MKIHPVFQTTIAKDAVMAWGTKYEKGTEIVFQNKVNSKVFGDFIITPPHPVSLYLAAGKKHTDKAIEISKKLLAKEDYVVFSHLNNKPNATAENSLKNDPNAYKLRKHDKDDIYQYLQESMGAIIHMIASIETLVNILIPADFTYTEKRFFFFKKKYDKKKIERYFSLERKIEIVAEKKNLTGVKQQSFWADFKTIKKIRDNVVHAKTGGRQLGIGEVYAELYLEIFDMDLNKMFNSILEFVKFLDPNLS